MSNISTKSALFWATIDKVLTNGFAFIISIVLARLIAPSEFGVVASAMIFTVMLSLFVEPGMTSSLIQKQKPEEIDYSTLFVFNLCAGVFLYLFLFISSPIIAQWLNLPILRNVLRVLGLQILIGSANSVQLSYVQKHMQFKNFFWCSFLSTVVAAVIAVLMAIAGYGVWALVANNILRSFILLVTVSYSFQWRFSFKFSRESFNEMFPFASKMLLTKFIDQGYVEATQTVITKMYSPTDLAFYNRGKSFPDIIINNLNSAIGNVLFPAFSQIQDDEKRLRESIVYSISMTSYICFPLLMGLLACAHNLIIVFLTSKWENSVVYLQIICIYYLWVPFSNIVWLSFKAIGASNRVLQLELIKITVNVLSLIFFIVILKTPIAIAISLACSYFISFVVESVYLVEYIGIRFSELLKSFFPSFLLSIIMGVTVSYIGTISTSSIVNLVVQIVVGIILYLLLSIIFNMPQLASLKSILQK